MAYTKQQKETIFNNIIDHISNGMSLRSALRRDDTFSKTIWDELIQIEENKTRYARARDERADLLFEEILEIADNSGNDKKTVEGGAEVTNHEAIQRDRLRVDARKWAASKMNPKKYGDKTIVEQTIDDKRKSVNDLFPTDEELNEKD